MNKHQQQTMLPNHLLYILPTGTGGSPGKGCQVVQANVVQVVVEIHFSGLLSIDLF